MIDRVDSTLTMGRSFEMTLPKALALQQHIDFYSRSLG